MNKNLAETLTIPWEGTPKTITGVGINSRLESIGGIVSAAIPFVFAFAGIGLLLMLIFGGFALLTSAGDAKKLEQGKQQITYAILGFVVIFLAYWIVQLAGKIFGIEEIKNIFG